LSRRRSLLSLITKYLPSDIVPYSGTECSFYLLSSTFVPLDSVLDSSSCISSVENLTETLLSFLCQLLNKEQLALFQLGV